MRSAMVAIGLGLAVLAGAAPAASAAETPTRAQIVTITNRQLAQPHPTDHNVYNNYSGDAWSGHFARYAWTVGGVQHNLHLPKNYAGTQAWRTQAGVRYRPYGDRLPQPADVLLWTDSADPTSGHVAVVTDVDTVRRTVVYVGGDENDSIVRHVKSWSAMGDSMAGKTFRGFHSLT
jgi:hypothetical protein